MPKPKTFTVEVTVVPTSGRTVTKKVTVTATSTLGEVLKAGDIDTDKKDITIDGKPATLDTKVTSVSDLKVEPQVKVTERPRGS